MRPLLKSWSPYSAGSSQDGLWCRVRHRLPRRPAGIPHPLSSPYTMTSYSPMPATERKKDISLDGSTQTMFPVGCSRGANGQ